MERRDGLWDRLLFLYDTTYIIKPWETCFDILFLWKLQRVNKKNKHHIVYPDTPSVRKPVPHVPKDIEISVPSAQGYRYRWKQWYRPWRYGHICIISTSNPRWEQTSVFKSSTTEWLNKGFRAIQKSFPSYLDRALMKADYLHQELHTSAIAKEMKSFANFSHFMTTLI